MLELRLRSGAVVAFDGRVLEVFDTDGGSRRFHVARLSTPKLVEESDGQGRIVLDDPSLALDVSHSEAPACKRLIAAVEQARAADGELDAV
jgi:ABC-type hemin transport system ATPase subunit